ncbi:MAG TPA: TonB-dependent receptor [Pseudomonadales bacterium]|nr:TonB-dependent receptor [Pseudomonadales bacterium]
MQSKHLAALAFACAATTFAWADDATTSTGVETIVVTAEQLNERRSGIQTQAGASTYTIDEAAIDALPAGDNTTFNQVMLRAPDVVQDSFGQFHVRGDHNDLQYRLNGIVLPEGIAVFGQSLSPRLISSMQLITGALPAMYGLRTAGVIDLSTKSGVLDSGGDVAVYGGSGGTITPSFEYGGSAGDVRYFVTGDYTKSDVGIDSPDGSTVPIHDNTTQYHGFGYFEDILDPSNRVSLIVGTSSGKYEIPNQGGLQPSLGLTVLGVTDYPSQALDENQRELTNYAIASWQHSAGALDLQSSLTTRYSSLTFTPDPVGDLLYNGIAQDAYKRDVAYGWQTDAAYTLNDTHTLRFGTYFQHDDAKTQSASWVLPVDAAGQQTTDVPITIKDNGTKGQWIESAYVGDQWSATSTLTINYGLRFDNYDGYSDGNQWSPRLNAVWKPLDGTTVFGGYSRYFTPPPFELIGTETVAKFANTTAAPTVTRDDAPIAEKADYYDLGIQQRVLDSLTLGVDGYYRKSNHLIDEGQFGAPIILTPFNYADGRIKGVEFTASYADNGLAAYANLALQRTRGQDIQSSQFNFDPDELAYIETHAIHLDHEQRTTASAGVSYTYLGTRFSADALFGSGLRTDLTLPDGGDIPNGAHLPNYTQFNLGVSHAFDLTSPGSLTARFDVINVFDNSYEIRNGDGVGVGAPQWGPRRGFYFGLKQTL